MRSNGVNVLPFVELTREFFAWSVAYATRYFPNFTCCQALQHIECFILWQRSPSSYHSNFAHSVCELLFCSDEECWLNESVIEWVCDWVFCCCRDAGTVFYVRCSWCCQGPLFFSVQYASITTDLPSTPLWHCTVWHCVVHIVQHHVYLCTSTTVLLFDSCQPTTMILYNSTLHWWCTVAWHVLHTGDVPLHDMQQYCILVMYRWMTCSVHWPMTIAWHVLYTGTVPLHDMNCTQVGWCCSCSQFYCCSCSYVPTCTLTLYVPNFTLTSSLCCALLIRRHATSGVVFLVCCVWMSNYFFLLACFNWVSEAICPSESSMRSPARGSHLFEWIEPGWSTGICSVWQLSVRLLKSCIYTSNLQDYS